MNEHDEHYKALKRAHECIVLLHGDWLEMHEHMHGAIRTSWLLAAVCVILGIALFLK